MEFTIIICVIIISFTVLKLKQCKHDQNSTFKEYKKYEKKSVHDRIPEYNLVIQEIENKQIGIEHRKKNISLLKTNKNYFLHS
jgi:hypothetical protein